MTDGTNHLNALSTPLEQSFTPAEVRAIAARIGITESGVWARIRAGDTGDRLMRPKNSHGEPYKSGPKRTKKPTRKNWDDQMQRERETRNDLMRRARLAEVSWDLVEARIEAGWPADRLLDPVRRWRVRRVFLRA